MTNSRHSLDVFRVLREFRVSLDFFLTAMTTSPSVSSSGLVLDVRPLLDAVRRHVPLSAAKEKLIRLAFEQVLGAQLLRPAAKPDPTTGSKTRSKTKKDGDDMVLTTQQAANLVKVSRPYLTARIDAGDIPLFQRVGNQRRILKSDLLAWQKRSRRQQLEALKQLGQSVTEEYEAVDL
ncbi:MAG: DNA-binding protein [Rubrivivax sp.]|nr:MAG: DNA-binding protein [Rubrivivax sp.]